MKWVAIILAAIGSAIYFLDSDLVNFFLPTRIIVLACLLTSTGLLILHLVRKDRGARSIPVMVLLTSTVLLAGVVYVDTYTAYDEVYLAFENRGARLAALSITITLVKRGI